MLEVLEKVKAVEGGEEAVITLTLIPMEDHSVDLIISVVMIVITAVAIVTLGLKIKNLKTSS